MKSGFETSAVGIVYFSGTGGSKRIADAFVQEITGRGLEVYKTALDFSLSQNGMLHAEDMLETVDLVVLIFPVHAFDAPIPIYDWVAKSKNQFGKKIIVISVSGGGEIWPNTGSRNNCCKALEEKGFRILYEKMMCMPSNWVVAINDHLAMHLIKVIPDKVRRILDDVFSGKIRRTHFRKSVIQSASQKWKESARGILQKNF